MAVADRFFGWLKLFKMDGKTLRILFAKMGVPVKLTRVGGPSFSSYDFGLYCKQWGIKHSLASAHYTLSNGWAEAAVKTVIGIYAMQGCTQP